MPAERRQLAFISLLRDDAEARELADLLQGLARSDARAAARFLVPDVRGLDFFADSDRQRELDRWWGANVPSDAVPVYLLSQERGLAAWLPGLDGVFFVVGEDGAADEYAQWTAVHHTDAAGAALALAEAVLTQYGTAASPARVFDAADARKLASQRAESDHVSSDAPAPVEPDHASSEAPAPVQPDNASSAAPAQGEPDHASPVASAPEPTAQGDAPPQTGAVAPLAATPVEAALSTPAARRRRRLPIENTAMYALALAFYIAVASYLVFHMHFMIGDAYARVDNAFDVLFTSDPHLAALGLFWPPLPSFLELPIIAFKPLWPDLVTKGFAGSIEAAAFSAGTVVLFNSGLRWAGVVRGLRWLLCLVWVVNPMTIIYAAQGMSEAPFIFFFVASILVFLRWSESRRTALLPLLGVLAGLGCLCRNEAFVIALVLGVGVAVQCLRDRASWREVETESLLYALPAVFVAMLWIGSQAVILHDPLYWIHANSGGSTVAAAIPGPPVAPPSSAVRASAYGLVHFNALHDAAAFILGHSLALFPAVAAFIAVVAARLVLQPRRVSGFVLLALGVSIPLVDVELITQGLAPDIRYQIAVIPFTFIMAVYTLRSLRGRRVLSTLVAAAMALALLVSTALGIQTLSDPNLAPQEAPVLAAFQSGRQVAPAAGESPMDVGADWAVNILALNKDHGRMLCDSTTCFPIILNVPDAKQFIVTSDIVFEAAAAQPQVYGVEYFLVPAPSGLGAFDRLNVLYPTLYWSGAGFARLVGSYSGWKLYKITGPTGRGG